MNKVPKTPQTTIKHFGILGMKWGIRKEYERTDNKPVGSEDVVLKRQKQPKGFIQNKDGSMTAPKGTNFQRLTYSGKDGTSKSRDLKDIAYVSVNDYDNAKYIKELGSPKKHFFMFKLEGRDQILNIKTTKTIKAPSMVDAAKIHSELIISNPQFQKSVRSYFNGDPISKRDLEDIKKDPTGKTALKWYWETNVMLAADSDWEKLSPYIRETFKQSVIKRGYNALRDENDSYNGLSKAPVIIFDPETCLRVTKMSDITDKLRAESKEKIKMYEAMGNDWIDKQLYGSN